MTEMADVSVIIPVRDGARYLPEALASVVDQSAPAAEIIVVDDGSTDRSGDVAARSVPSARVITQAATGYAAAMNRGIAEATSPVLAFLDADDHWALDALASRLERLAADDAPDVVVGVTRNFISPDLSEAEAARIRVEDRPLQAELLAAVMVRASAFDRVGLLDESLRATGGIDWISRARSTGIRFAYVDQLVLHRRLHASNLGRTDQADRNAELMRTVRAHHARHRPD